MALVSMLWILFAHPAHALTEPLPRLIKFQHLLENKDFSLGDVRGVLQDSRGFMWFGGANGLIRYDGYEFKFISRTPETPDQAGRQAEGRPVRNVTGLYEDSEHTLWIITSAQLLRYDPLSEALTAIPDQAGSPPISNTNLRGMVEMPGGELLVPTWNGLFVVDRKTGRYTVLLADSSKKDWLQSSVINTVFRDKTGVVWLGTSVGLERLDWETRTFSLVKPYPQRPDLLPPNQVFKILEDRDASLWLGTPDGLVNYSPKTQQSIRYVNDPKDKDGFSGKPVEDLMLDANGVLWVATDGGGFSIFERTAQFPQGHFVTHRSLPDQASSLSTNVVRAIFEDRSGDIWVGNYPSGINYLDRSNEVLTTLFDDPQSKSRVQNAILAVREDAKRNLWLGTDGGGLNRLDRATNQLTNYKPEPGNPNSLSGSAVLDVLIADDGKVWTGTWDGGVSVLDPATGKFRRLPFDVTRLNAQSVTTSRRLNNDSVWSVKQDRQKTIWLGTFRGGLSKFDVKTETFTHYSHRKDDPTSISFGVVWNTFEDSKGNFWVGTTSGLDLMDRTTGTFRHFKTDPKNPGSLSNTSVTAFLEDSKQRLWVGTEAGLNLLNPDGKTFTIFNKATGFNDDSIKTIVEDAQGQLWLATNSGVSIFNPDTGEVKNISRDGGRLMGIFHIDSGLLSSSGEVVFGGVGGLRIFSPKKLRENRIPPPIVFTGLKVFNNDIRVGGADGILSRSLNNTQSLVLDYRQNMLQLNFAALNFRDSHKNQYAYKLEGFDRNWLSAEDRRAAVYTNLDAGTYQFRVKGSNNDGVWNNDGATITIVQLPPPWQTWWAYTLYVLLLVLGIALLIRSQWQKRLAIEEQNRLLEIKVAERTMELANNNLNLEEANKKLEEVSLSDPLTGLNNRRYLYKTLPLDIAKATRAYSEKDGVVKNSEIDLIIFLLDVDHFKSVNDIHGHNNGDKVLIQLADIFRKVCRDSDLIIRWGGEEFMVVGRFTHRDQASHIAERIRQAVAQHPFEMDNHSSIHVTCSIGYACFPFNIHSPEVISLEQTINIADYCLYKVKSNQRNGWLGLCQVSDNLLTAEQLLSDPQQRIQNGDLVLETSIRKSLEWGNSPHP
ncbi:MAG: two-component regulator propeller domain-containing protein [Pseudomonadota bacterium]